MTVPCASDPVFYGLLAPAGEVQE